MSTRRKPELRSIQHLIMVAGIMLIVLLFMVGVITSLAR